MLFSVPKHALTAMADAVETGILNDSRDHLRPLGKIVGSIFFALLLAALIIVRKVR